MMGCMEYTQPVDWIEKPFVGYVMNAELSDQNAQVLNSLTQSLRDEFGDALYCMTRPSLHITLLDWIAPLVDYDGRDKAELFAQIQPSYDRAMTDIMAGVGPISVHFDTIRVAPSTIFAMGHDDGQFQHIRDEFVQKVDLLPGTKMPPQIIHSSLIRFTEAIELEPIAEYIKAQKIDFVQDVTSFRLVHTRQEPMLDFEVLKRYELS